MVPKNCNLLIYRITKYLKSKIRFSDAENVTILNLSDNKLTIIKQNTFVGLRNLHYLRLDRNQITEIEDGALVLPNLRTFDLKGNKLRCTSENLFPNTPYLGTFSADRNEITSIGSSLNAFTVLEATYLRNNKLSVDLSAFSDLPELLTLLLGDTGLSSDDINKIDLKEPSNSPVKYLQLQSNKLSNEEDFVKISKLFPALEILDIQGSSYSKIATGDKTLRQLFPKLRRIYAGQNKWDCSWFKTYM